MANTVSIVIPVYGQWSYTLNLLNDIRQYWRPDEIIIVDDCSQDFDTKNGCNFWKSLLPIKYCRNNKNLGFLLSANKGIQMANGQIIICMNNDVRLGKSSRQSIVSSWQFILQNTTSENCLGGTLVEHGGWNEFGHLVFPYLEGWFLSATRKNWDGGFDERYAPSDFEDVDKSTSWLHQGLILQQMPSGSVIHLGAKSYGYTPERQARTERNRKKFMEKWGLE